MISKNHILKKKVDNLLITIESLKKDKIIFTYKNDVLKTENENVQNLHKESEFLKNIIDSLAKKKNETLMKKTTDLDDIILKFINGQKNFEKLLSSRKCVFDKCDRI